MTRTPFLSVIVPIYNVASYLEQCITSICNQTYTNIEIILVNDGSSDQSGTICDYYSQRDTRVRVIHKENGGLVSARKVGVAIARGTYITFVDGDDWIDADTYATLLTQCMDQCEPDVIAYGCVEEYSDFQKKIINSVPVGMYRNKQLDALQEKILMGDIFFEWRLLPHLCDKVIKRELLVKAIARVSDCVTFGEDAACSFPCMMEASSIYVSDYTPYHYRQREGSIVKSSKELALDNFIAIYSVLSEAFGDKEELRIQLKKYIYFLLLLKKYSAIADLMPLTPFKKVQAGDKVFVYGAGGFGSVIEKFVEESDELELAGWTDQRASFLQKTNPKIDCYEGLFTKEYDRIVIAILNEKTAEKIKADFVEKGIPESKIDWVRGDVIEKLKLPKWLSMR